MSDLISRQAAIDALRMDIDIIPYAKAREYARAVIETVYNRLEHLPAAQPRKGEWIEKEHDVPLAWDDSPSLADVYDEESHSIKQKWWHCSECGYEADRFTHPFWNFCPNCGARMVGGEQDG